jgi:hypothetical protein
MPNYSKGKIYKLVNDELGLTYYGSTIQPLYKRIYGHRSKLNCSSKILFTEGECKIYLVEEFPCDNRNQLEKRERFFIENNDCVNKNIPCRTYQEYNDATKDKRSEYKKKYNQKNKEEIKEKNKIYYEKKKEYRSQKITCECGAIVSLVNLKRHKTESKKHLSFN